MTSGEIVYSARIYFPPGDKRVSRFQIYSARPDGSGRVALTTGNADSLAPKWSPDGSRVLFWQSSGAAGMKLCVVAAEGGTPRVVAAFLGDEFVMDSRWHPDGRRVALLRSRYGGGAPRSIVEIWDTQTRSMASRFPDATDYALSPSGSLLYLTDGKAGQLIRLNEKERAAPMPVLDSPVWKDDETLVALSQGDADKGEGYFGVQALIFVDATGKTTRKVTPRPVTPMKPDDGPVAVLHLARAMPNRPDDFLLYCEHREADFYALISLADGAITQTRTGYKRPVWSPDGRQFVTYSSRNLSPYGPGGKQVYIGPVYVGTDLTHPDRKITPGLSWCGGVDWRPKPVAG